jgi:hypothetical protein
MEEIYPDRGSSICSSGTGLNKKKKKNLPNSKTMGTIKTKSLSLGIISFFVALIDCLYFTGFD